MLTRLGRSLDADDGISLVEMMVALLLLGVAMSASAGFFTTALRSMQQAEGRTKATALANEEMENLRGLPWAQVGFHPDDFPGAVPADTVLLEEARSAASRAPLPEQVLPPRGGVVYTVRRSITWNEDNPQTSARYEYKHLVVAVDWSDRGQPRSISVESQRTPNPDEQPSSDFVLSLLAVKPKLVYLNADGTLDATRHQELLFTALTSAKADFVVTRYRQRGDIADTEQSLGSSDRRNWSGTVTPLQGHRFPNGDALFTFVATRANPYAQEVFGTTLVRFLQPLVITAVTLSPSAVCVTDELGVAPAIDVAIEVDGLVEEDSVWVRWSGGEVKAGQVSPTPSGSSLTARIPPGAFGVGTHSLTVEATRLSDSQTQSVSGSLTVYQQEVC